MKKLNLTALVLLSFIAKAGYGSADGSTMVAAAGGGAPSVADNRVGNLLTSGIAGAVTHFLSNDKGIDERIALGLSDDDLRALFQNPRIAQIYKLKEDQAQKKMGHFFGTAEKWRYDQKVEEFITSYFAQAPRDDAALKDKLSEIRPDDDATVMGVLDNYSDLCDTYPATYPAPKQKAFMETLFSIAPEDLNILFDGITNARSRTYIIETLNTLNSAQREAFIPLAKMLFDGVTNGWRQAEIIEELKDLTLEEIRARASSGAASSRKSSRK